MVPLVPNRAEPRLVIKCGRCSEPSSLSIPDRLELTVQSVRLGARRLNDDNDIVTKSLRLSGGARNELTLQTLGITESLKQYK